MGDDINSTTQHTVVKRINRKPYLMNVEYITFNERAERSRYIAKRFSDYVIGNVLDIGCDKAVLKALLKDIKYTGIYIGGTPDIQINLDKVERLPFDDNIFDASVCSDVLEHLDNLHLIFGEIVRVSNKYIIISLPNNWANARKPIERGTGSFSHYGLPPAPPLDRHKWFFGLSEAISFCTEQEKLYPISINDSKRKTTPSFNEAGSSLKVSETGALSEQILTHFMGSF